jgi:transposase
MIKLDFTDAEKAALEYERYHHPHPRVQRKMEALWLKSQQVPHRQISQLTGICSTTLTSYLRRYEQGGLEALKEIRWCRPQSELQAHRGTLEGYFRAHPPATAKEAMAKIEELTGVKRSEERVRVFLKGLGMDCRKVGMVPAKADVAVQEEFKKKS